MLTIEFGFLQYFHFANVDILEWIDTSARFFDFAANAVGDPGKQRQDSRRVKMENETRDDVQFVNHLFEFAASNIAGHDFHHFLTNGFDLEDIQWIRSSFVEDRHH